MLPGARPPLLRSSSEADISKGGFVHTQGHNRNSDPRIEVLSKKRESSTFLLHGRRSSQDCGNGHNNH